MAGTRSKARWSRAAAGVVLYCCACGGDEQGALPVNIRSLRADALPGPTAQAVLDLRLEDEPPGSCPEAARAALPGASAVETVSSNAGLGERLIDGPEASVGCRVEPLEERFYVDLRIDHDALLPRFRARGSAGLERAELDVEVTLPAAPALSAQCEGELEVIVEGAVWIRALTCTAPSRDAQPLAACALRGGVIFENCVF
jgi:hypothetical protein